MKIGVASWSFEALSLKAALAVCSDLGFNYVDIGAFHRGRCTFDPFELAAHPEKYAHSLTELLGSYGMSVGDLHPHFGRSLGEYTLNDPDPEARRSLRRLFAGLFRFAKLAGIPGITVSPGVKHAGLSHDINLANAAEEIRILTGMAGELGIQFRFEPHVGAIANDPDSTLYIVGGSPETKITFDPAHFYVQYVDTDTYQALIPYVGHVHVRQAREGKLQTRTEEGAIDFAKWLSLLHNRNYQGVLAVEYVHMDWYDCNRVDCLTETVKTRNSLEQLLNALNQMN